MLKKILFISFVLFSGSVFAKTDVSNLVDTWGGGQMVLKGDNSISNSASCIGKSYPDSCGGDEVGHVLMMVARKVNEHCAKFCPTDLSNNGDSETVYYEVSKGNDCVWLCHDGQWSELDTTITSPDNYCENDELKHDSYKEYYVCVGCDNIEGNIPRFADGRKSSGEHDMILAITGYLNSGHGAYVQQMVVRAHRGSQSFFSSSVSVYPAGASSEILVCRPGYSPSGNECVPATQACDEHLDNLCTGWNASGFDGNIHKFKYDQQDGCNIYQCKTPGYAFPDTEGNVIDYSCSKCIEVVNKDGVNPKNGACVHCETGKVFEELTNNQGYVCSDAQQLTRQELQYGKGKTTQGDIRNLSLNEQCWVKDTMDDYRQCVLPNYRRASDTYTRGLIK